jgi:hypothetical protein
MFRKPGGATSTARTAGMSVKSRWAAIALAMSIGFMPVLRCIFSATEHA